MAISMCPIVVRLTAAFGLAIGLLAADGTHAATVQRASVSSTGAEGDGDSYFPSISANGRYLGFYSYATNLVPGDHNGSSDVFVLDLQTGQLRRVSLDSAGTEGNGNSIWSSLSADGHYVAFSSDASNLVHGDTNAQRDIFVHDTQSARTTRISVNSAGAQSDGASYRPEASADGSHVAFHSMATNLVPGDTNAVWDAFVHDLQTGQTQRISVDSSGGQTDLDSYGVSVSADGQVLAFFSRATALVAGDSNGRWDIFVHDRTSGLTTRVSVDSAGNQGDGDSQWPSLSADGRFVAFYSLATNLVPGDTNARADAFVHDRSNGQTTRVSLDSTGTQGDGDTYGVRISADGQRVAFHSYASNLVSADSNGLEDVFVHDRASGRTTRISESDFGVGGDGDSYQPSLSANGRRVAFASAATQLVPGDSNNVSDVFLWLQDSAVPVPLLGHRAIVLICALLALGAWAVERRRRHA